MNKCEKEDLNLWLHAYQTCALPTELFSQVELNELYEFSNYA